LAVCRREEEAISWRKEIGQDNHPYHHRIKSRKVEQLNSKKSLSPGKSKWVSRPRGVFKTRSREEEDRGESLQQGAGRIIPQDDGDLPGVIFK